MLDSAGKRVAEQGQLQYGSVLCHSSRQHITYGRETTETHNKAMK